MIRLNEPRRKRLTSLGYTVTKVLNDTVVLIERDDSKENIVSTLGNTIGMINKILAPMLYEYRDVN
tara:strand:+ start:93 stop:290 length:198 start_codon:yes stop_codon:yes gene_type:complete